MSDSHVRTGEHLRENEPRGGEGQTPSPFLQLAIANATEGGKEIKRAERQRQRERSNHIFDGDL